jgi:hypothetical protein
MATDAPIFSSEFLTSYGNWLMAIGFNSWKLWLYITFNCLFIIFFERIADPSIAFGDVLENAPYYFISANDFRSSDRDQDDDGKSSIEKRKRQRAQAPAIYDVYLNSKSEKMIDRIIPRVFRIDQTTALPPYNYIAVPDKCTNAAAGDCISSISKDTFFSYFITIITFVMWGYRQGLKMFSFWNTVLINQSPTQSAIWYQICIKFLLILGWLVFAMISVFTFFYSMTWGIYAVFFEHFPKASLYKVGNVVPWYLGGMLFNPLIRVIWYILLCIFQVIVAILAITTGLLMWAPGVGPIFWSIVLWIWYPVLETMLWNFANSWMRPLFHYPPTTPGMAKNFHSIVSLVGNIYSNNIQFITLLIIGTIYYSSLKTMDDDFTNGVGLVGSAIFVLVLFRAISAAFK